MSAAPWRAVAIAVLLALSATACRRSQSSASGGGTAAPTASKHGEPGSSEPPTADAKFNVPTATEPASDCAWISAAEAEAVLGPLLDPPTGNGVCRYTLKMPEAVTAARAKSIQDRERLEAALKKRFADYKPEKPHGELANYEGDPKTYAMVLEVSVNASDANQRAFETVARKFGADVEGDATRSKAADAQPTGWDRMTPTPFTFIGRLGHVEVTVEAKAPDVPSDLMKALAERVRDRIPDLPFRAKNRNQIQPLHGGGEDPCSLITRDDAEAVLGKLVVAPYRSSSYFPLLAHPQGLACAYFTAGHHVLAIHPYWSDGEKQWKLEKGIGGLVNLVAPQDMLVVKGPWDNAQISMTGSFQALKGDRLLEVYFTSSSTDRAGAIKLAAQAMKRFSS